MFSEAISMHLHLEPRLGRRDGLRERSHQEAHVTVQDLADRDRGAATVDDFVRHLAQQPGEPVGRVVELRGAPDEAFYVEDRREHRGDVFGLRFGKLPTGLIEVLEELEIVDRLDGALEDGDGELLKRREVPDE